MEESRKEKNAALRKFWGSHINRWASSGMSQAAYCRQKNLIRHRFSYWKRKLGKKNFPVQFVRIATEPEAIHSPGLKLNISPDFQIEIPDGFSRETLEQVLAALRGLK